MLEKIEQQTAYVFVFSNDEILAARKITLNVKDKRLEEVLEMICSPLAIRYELISNKIIRKQGKRRHHRKFTAGRRDHLRSGGE